MIKTVKVSLCAGTTCYVMGGKALLDLEDRLPDDLIGKVKIDGSNCLGLCREGTPPFVKIDGDPLDQATEDRIIAAVRNRLSK